MNDLLFTTLNFLREFNPRVVKVKGMESVKYGLYERVIKRILFSNANIILSVKDL